jgi:hypothetical protein
VNQTSVRATLDVNCDGVFYAFDEQANPDDEIG